VGLNQKEQKTVLFLYWIEVKAVLFILVHIPINDIDSTPSWSECHFKQNFMIWTKTNR